MPPKKMKPNEKCYCGSGKKHKKCCGNPTLVSDLMDELSLTTTVATATATAVSENRPCFHGSTSDRFPDERTYRTVIHDYLSVSKDERPAFMNCYQGYFTDLNFSRYVFAVCTSWYLKTNRTTEDMRALITMASEIKYLYEPISSRHSGCSEGPDTEKMYRYHRAIMNNDDRGVMNSLSRETKPYCDCMKNKKKEAKGMDKTEYCDGCKRYFPRGDGMLKCDGCNTTVYCTKKCYKKYWPRHKGDCKELERGRVALLAMTCTVRRETAAAAAAAIRDDTTATNSTTANKSQEP